MEDATKTYVKVEQRNEKTRFAKPSSIRRLLRNCSPDFD